MADPSSAATDAGSFELEWMRDWPAPALLASAGGTVLAWNEDARGLLGLLDASHEGLQLADALGPDEAARLLAGESDVELEIPGGGAGPRAVRARSARLAGERVVVTLDDISGERLLRAHLEQAERLASIGELLSSVAHELNNPLTSVLGYAEILLGEDAPGLPRDELRAIHGEATRCRRIVENLLDLSRGEALTLRPLLVRDVVAKVVEFREYAARATNTELVADVESGLPFVMGDLHRLVQAVLNLVTNAEHAVQTRASGRRIAVRARRAAAHVSVEVEDNGPGVPPALADAVFQPFFTTKPRGRGTGLGLSLVRAAAQAHGGSIRVERAQSGGARFVLELPAAGDV